MNSPALGLRVASVLFGLMALGHLIRVILGMGVQVGACLVGRRFSVIAVIILAALCVWMWTLASQAAGSKTETPPTKPTA